MDAARVIVPYYNCGRNTKGWNDSMKASARMISGLDKLAQCHNCHLRMKSKEKERPWNLWDGIKAFGASYSAMVGNGEVHSHSVNTSASAEIKSNR